MPWSLCFSPNGAIAGDRRALGGGHKPWHLETWPGAAGDLKPENFCLSDPLSSGKTVDDVLRLIDFGLSQRVRGGQAIAGQAGSIPYMAPEISTRMYDYKVDIWSIGVILYTLLQGKLPFDGRTAQEIMNRASTQAPDMAGVHNAVADFLQWCGVPLHGVALPLALASAAGIQRTVLGLFVSATAY